MLKASRLDKHRKPTHQKKTVVRYKRNNNKKPHLISHRKYLTPASFLTTPQQSPTSPKGQEIQYTEQPKPHNKPRLTTAELLQQHHRYNVGKSPLAPKVPDITENSSFFHRGIAAIYDTPELTTKLNMIDDARRLLRKNAIPLINWHDDKEMYLYLHFGTTDISQLPSNPTIFNTIKPQTPESFYYGDTDVTKIQRHIWGDIVQNPSNVWVTPARPEKPHLYHRVFGAKDINVPLNTHIVHTLAHIELNAVEMYLDTVLRFGILPPNGNDHIKILKQQYEQQIHDENFVKNVVLNDLHHMYTSYADGTNNNNNNNINHDGFINPFSLSYFPGTLIPRIPQGPLYTTNPKEYNNLVYLNDLTSQTTKHQQPRRNLNLDERFPIYDDGFNITHPDFNKDLLTIVSDETRHFRLCCDRLVELSEQYGVDHTYGSQPATYQLWVLGVNTRNDIAERLAVIPLSQEARGLDSTTRFINRLYSMNDKKSAALVFLIGKEEERHVSLGLKWFLYTAAARGIVTPGYCAEYDYNYIPPLDLQEEEHWDYIVTPKNQQKKKPLQRQNKNQSANNNNNNNNNNDNRSWDEYDLSSQYWTDSEHVVMCYDEKDVTSSPIAPSTAASTPLQNPHLQTGKPVLLTQHVKRISDESIISNDEKLQCDRNIALFWQNNVRDHFDIGFVPPFNRLARYASGMPESWYVPLAWKKDNQTSIDNNNENNKVYADDESNGDDDDNTIIPPQPFNYQDVQFISVPSNAPQNAPIRKHFAKIIAKMDSDHNSISQKM